MPEPVIVSLEGLLIKHPVIRGLPAEQSIVSFARDSEERFYLFTWLDPMNVHSERGRAEEISKLRRERIEGVASAFKTYQNPNMFSSDEEREKHTLDALKKWKKTRDTYDILQHTGEYQILIGPKDVPLESAEEVVMRSPLEGQCKHCLGKALLGKESPKFEDCVRLMQLSTMRQDKLDSIPLLNYDVFFTFQGYRNDLFLILHPEIKKGSFAILGEKVLDLELLPPYRKD